MPLPFALSTGISAISAIGGILSSSSAERAEARAREANAAITRLQNRQDRARFVQQFVQAQAADLAASIGAGAGFDSSRTQGLRASNATQARRGLTDLDEQARLGEIVNRNLGAASRRRNRAGAFALAGQAAQTFSDDLDRAGQATGIFS